MKISNKIEMKKMRNGTIIVFRNGLFYLHDENDIHFDQINDLYNKLRPMDVTLREEEFKQYFDIINEPTTEEASLTNEQKLTQGLNNLINFFKEFEFEPNFRFVNTLSFKVAESQKSAKEYIENYFSLIDNSYQHEIKNKIKSKEFNEILKDIGAYGTPNKVVNNRFDVYYGSAGTGKTTLAMEQSDNRCVVCNASMLPSDLMEDFVFQGGQPTFQKSTLWNCIEQGLPLVLDEINLLPFDSLRFLQGILDGKKEFTYKGSNIVIADGFKIIGTMNLTIGGMVYGLPEPLIDRCANIQKFTLTAKQLALAIKE